MTTLTASPALSPSVTVPALRLASWVDAYDALILRGWSHEAAAIAVRKLTASR